MPVIEEAILERENEMLQEICPKKDSCGILRQALREKDRIETENENLREAFRIATEEFTKKNQETERLKLKVSNLWDMAGRFQRIFQKEKR